jgi:hypothetical protein
LSPKHAKDGPEEVVSKDLGPTADSPNASTGAYNGLEDYEYKSLSSERHIRVLRMHAPRKGREQYIECELLPIDLDQMLTSFLYTAVSYTWDGQKPDRYVLCEGKRLAVTKN